MLALATWQQMSAGDGYSVIATYKMSGGLVDSIIIKLGIQWTCILASAAAYNLTDVIELPSCVATF